MPFGPVGVVEVAGVDVVGADVVGADVVGGDVADVVSPPPQALRRGKATTNNARQMMIGIITCFKKQNGNLFGHAYKKDIKNCFGTLDIEIACIKIEKIEILY